MALLNKLIPSMFVCGINFGNTDRDCGLLAI